MKTKNPSPMGFRPTLADHLLLIKLKNKTGLQKADIIRQALRVYASKVLR